MRMLLLGALALLTACVTPPPAPETPREIWLASTAGYAFLVVEAGRYEHSCQIKPKYQQARCRAIVEIIRDLDNKAAEAQRVGNLSFVDNDNAMLAEATAQLERIRDDLETTLASETVGEDAYK